MSEPFLGEVRMFGFTFAPRGWAFCDGQILPINQNQALYSLIGSTYGGDGRTSFALPDLRGRVPVHVGSEVALGQRAGTERHALSAAELPSHRHGAGASGDQATRTDPTDAVTASQARRGVRIHASGGTPVALRGDPSAGGGGAHENMQPFLVLGFCIALQGVFPSRN
ncbi:MAG: phage tail protein [Ectothiorhodospiraceae bacterium]|nr:phage tail protein [Chromatiales bacterium]MCP5156545.1 phage tail protein [Ectothiorhodospiraceae bacterium]